MATGDDTGNLAVTSKSSDESRSMSASQYLHNAMPQLLRIL